MGDWPGCPSAGEETWHGPTDLIKAGPESKLHSYAMTARLPLGILGTPPFAWRVSTSGIWVRADPHHCA